MIPSLTLEPSGKDKSIMTRLPDPSGLSRVMRGDVCVQGSKGGRSKGPNKASFPSSFSMNASTAAGLRVAEAWFVLDAVGMEGAV